MLVLDITDDLFQHVLDGDQAGHATVFIHHDGHVITVGTKILQQNIKALALGNEYRWAQHIAQIKAVFSAFQGFGITLAKIGQQVFGQQNADHIIASITNHGKAGMRRLHHYR